MECTNLNVDQNRWVEAPICRESLRFYLFSFMCFFSRIWRLSRLIMLSGIFFVPFVLFCGCVPCGADGVSVGEAWLGAVECKWDQMRHDMVTTERCVQHRAAAPTCGGKDEVAQAVTDRLAMIDHERLTDLRMMA